MSKNIFLLTIILPFFWACNPKKMEVLELEKLPITNKTKAQKLAHQFVIADGHVDLPYRLKILNFRFQKEFIGLPVQSDEGDFDFKRSREGGLDAPFMSIYVQASLQKEAGESKLMADSLINMVTGIASSHPDHFSIVTTPQEVRSNFTKGIVSLPMGMENGSPIEEDINNVAYFRERGISYITLTHSLNNNICDSSYDTITLWNGLSAFGEDVVAEMNKEGIMVDISHVSDETFFDVMELTKAPVIASHSSCRKFTPDFERNMSDEMLVKLAENKGVIMINFGSTFLSQEVMDKRDSLGVLYRSKLKELGLEHGEDEAQTILDGYFKNNPLLWTDVDVVVDHIEHVIKTAGIDHVGFGSDFDGVGDTLPKGLKDVSDYPNVIEELLNRGYNEAQIEKICYKNIERVWTKVLETSENLKKM